MKLRFARMMALLAVVGILGIAFLLLRPGPEQPLFWCLLLPAIAANIGYIVLSRLDRRDHDTETEDWLEEIRELVGDAELDSALELDPHLADYGRAEREEILDALRRQPTAARSLDTALRETGLDFRERVS